MSKVVLDVSMSLDGFTAGPNVREAAPLGDGGERLHEWTWTAGNGPDSEVDTGFRTVDAMVGAAVIGRRTFDLGMGPWGGTPWPGVPGFVVTHRIRQDLPGDNGGTFAFDGLEAAGLCSVPRLHRHNQRKFEKWYDQIEPLGSDVLFSLKG